MKKKNRTGIFLYYLTIELLITTVAVFAGYRGEYIVAALLMVLIELRSISYEIKYENK